MAALSTRGPPVEDSEEAETLACRCAMEFPLMQDFQSWSSKAIMQQSWLPSHTLGITCLDLAI